MYAVLLVASEVVADAVQHAGGMAGFRLDAWPGAVTVRVQDNSGALPRPVHWAVGRPAGLCRHLVQELSNDVRVDIHAAGKAVAAMWPCPHCPDAARLTHGPRSPLAGRRYGGRGGWWRWSGVGTPNGWLG